MINNCAFDWHKWKTDIYKASAEIDAAIKSFGIAKKTIKAINVIGMARDMQKWCYVQNMRRTLAGVGVSYEDIDSENYPYIDDTLLPCEVEICEPVVFGVTLQNNFFDIGNATAKIKYGEIKAATKNVDQVPIIEGHDSSSYFWIMPVKQVARSEEYWRGVDEYRPEEISIEEDNIHEFLYYLEDNIHEFLYYFLDKYFDPSFPYTCRDDCGDGFEWNLEYNIYTYDAIRLMLIEIAEYTDLLRTDYDNPKLDELKKFYHAFSFYPDYYHVSDPPPADEIIRKNINVVIDFYERFCRRMNAMMAHTPQYGLISFMGP